MIWRIVTLAASAALVGPPLSGAQLAPYVGVIGCSTSGLVEQAYRNVSARDAAYNATNAGGDLLKWASAKTWRASFDAPFKTHATSAVWWPICVLKRTGYGEAQAWRDFTAAVAQLRARTNAQLYVTDKIGMPDPSAPDCAKRVDTALMRYVAERAVAENIATRSEPELPPGVGGPNCGHFDPVLSTNVGEAAAAFIDG